MSFDAQWTALYRLFYKRNEREVFFCDEDDPVKGLSDAERETLRGIGVQRFEHVVALHQRDIGANWYQPRVPSTWLALQSLLGLDEPELVARLTESSAFEDRLDDDRDGRALLAFINHLLNTNVELATSGPWLPELLRYELYLGGFILLKPAEVVDFQYSVCAIREALLDQQLCPEGEVPDPNFALFVKTDTDICEVMVDVDQAEVLRGIIDHQPVSRISHRLPKLQLDEVEAIHAECRSLLEGLNPTILDG